MEKKVIQSFTDLYAWQEGHKLVLLIYKMIDSFPRSEMFNLTNQMRRCAVSITSNIAEGFSRYTNKDKHQFYTIAQGSLTELQNQLFIARDIKYINLEEYDTINQQTIRVSKLLTGLKRIRNSS